MPLFKKRLLKPAWTLQTGPNDIIWKLLIAPNGILTGEERNPEAKTSSLFAIDLETKKVLWRGKHLQEAWWFTTEKATSDVLLIQTFQSRNLPQPMGIIAIDIRTGSELWAAPEYVLTTANQNECLLTELKHGIKSHLSIDIHTGTVLKNHGSKVPETFQEMYTQELDPHSHYVDQAMPEDAKFAEIMSLAHSSINPAELRGPIEFLHFERYLILSFHERITDDPKAALQNLLQNRILVLDTDSREIVLQETLESRTPLPLPDSFFVSHRTLIYVKEKQTLVGIRLD